MRALMTREATTVIGVDFGACSLRAVQLRGSGSSWRVHHWLNLETEPTSPEPIPPHTVDRVKMGFGPGTFAGRSYVFNLSPPTVDFQRLDVPPTILEQGEAPLRTALQIELDRQSPWSIAEAEVAVWPVRDDTAGKVPAVVVTAHRRTLEDRLAMFTEHGLTCIRADILPHGFRHLAPAALSDAPAGQMLWAVLDIGFSSSRLYLIHDGRVVYARRLKGGGCELTETLAKTLKVNFAMAEKYKRIYGIAPTDRGFRSMLGGLSRITEAELPGVLYAILRPTIEAVQYEIERSYRFALGQFPGTVAGPLVLTGGGARLQGLVDVLGSALGVPVGLPEPGTMFDLAGGATDGGLHPALKPTHYAVLAPSMGLALNEELS